MRRLADWTITRTAEGYGCSPSHISRVERGDPTPSRELVRFYEETFEAMASCTLSMKPLSTRLSSFGADLTGDNLVSGRSRAMQRRSSTTRSLTERR